MRQLKISLTDDLRRQLAKVSAAAGHSLALEIRRRLERTLEQDGSDRRPANLWLQSIASRPSLTVRPDMLGTLMPELTKRSAGPLTYE